VRNCRNMQNILKIHFVNISVTKAQIFMKFMLIGKYYATRNTLHANTRHTPSVNVHMQVLSCLMQVLSRMRAFTLVCKGVCLHLWEYNFCNSILSLSRNFFNNQAFCGDIYKIKFMFFNHQFPIYFSYFHRYGPPKPSGMDNY